MDLYDQDGKDIALVLSDWLMPRMDGVELLHVLRVRDPMARVVIMSGYPPEADSRELVEQGVVEWVEKPLDPGKLARVVSNVLR